MVVEKKKYPIVCLCGSTRFMDYFLALAWYLTLKEEIVLSVGVCKSSSHHAAEAISQEVADKLDYLHLGKIDLADYIYVININEYIGESTAKEIEYARSKNKNIYYLNGNKELLDKLERYIHEQNYVF